MHAYIRGISYHLPSDVEFNDAEDRLTDKIGIRTRSVSGLNETAGDMAVQAAEKLIQKMNLNRDEIDYVLFCTQSPDYLLPSTACIIQERLGLKTTCGALDFNLGCSGYVYGLSLAKGLVEASLAKNVLLLTGDTYSKYIHPMDRSVRVLFGDAASATLIGGLAAAESSCAPLDAFVFGTDGRGAKNLIVPAGGHRNPVGKESFIEQVDSFGNTRSMVNLYMNGPEIFNFTLREIPNAIERLLVASDSSMDSFDWLVFHQANKYMLSHLQKKLKVDPSKFPVDLEDCGNTVSSTIPIVLCRLKEKGQLIPDQKLMLVGFGVGYSWAACQLRWVV